MIILYICTVFLLCSESSWCLLFKVKDFPGEQNIPTSPVSLDTSDSLLTTVIPTNNSFSCSKPGKFSASLCPVYYECTLKAVLKICPENELFDSTSETCRPNGEINCSDCPDLTPTQPPFVHVEPPNCSGPGKFPTSYCANYYECTSVWWWYESRVQTCTYGTLFDRNLRECADASTVDCSGLIKS